MSSHNPRPTSPQSAHSRQTSITQQQFAPLNPSSLRNSHTVSTSPEDTRHMSGEGASGGGMSSSETSPNTVPTHLNQEPEVHGNLDGTHEEDGFATRAVNEATFLLRKPFEFVAGAAHAGPCNHGTFSPGLQSRTDSIRSGYSGIGFGILPSADRPGSAERSKSLLGNMWETMGKRPSVGKKKMSTTSTLAERHGIKNTTMM